MLSWTANKTVAALVAGQEGNHAADLADEASFNGWNSMRKVVPFGELAVMVVRTKEGGKLSSGRDSTERHLPFGGSPANIAKSTAAADIVVQKAVAVSLAWGYMGWAVLTGHSHRPKTVR